MRLRSALLAILAAGAVVRPVRAEIGAQEVRDAIDRAAKYLLRQQAADGSWPDMAGYPGGVTSLCVLALLNAGVEPQDPRIQKSLAALRSLPPTMTYCTALQTMVFCAAEPKKDLLLIRRNAKWLEEKQIRAADAAGSWAYPLAGRGDNSNAQFALLALYEAERVGVPVADHTWRLALDHWLKCQNGDGSWGYHPGEIGTGSMTCAGISSVIIAAGQLQPGDAKVDEAGRVLCCQEQSQNKAVENGLAWLSRNFSVEGNPGTQRSRTWLYYYLYGLERAGRLSNRRFIGRDDWYRRGADFLVRQQDVGGSWVGTGHAENDPDIATCLALLFLSKGRRPIVAAKLLHEPDADWNLHRSDVANLTSFVEKQWQRDLTWQLIDPAAASVEDLLQAPVLVIGGSQPPKFSDEQERNLRDYVDRGGFILASGCCGGERFQPGFSALMERVFPEAEYRLKPLEPSHPIWRAELPVHPDSRFVGKLWGIDRGCRTAVVLCEEDLSCYWELARSNRPKRYPQPVQLEVDSALAIGANVLAYATNREVRFKESAFDRELAERASDPFDRGKLYAARLKHDGGCNVAPAALSNLLRVAANKLHLHVEPEPREIAASDPSLFEYHLVFMHGRHEFRFTPKEREGLKAYLERGGMLFVDAICSSKQFAESFRKEMATIFPDKPLARIPATHPLFTPEFGGDDLSRVARRQHERTGNRGPLKTQVREGEPVLEGLEIGDRYAVILSPYDISCALENHESLECEGYTRTDAARIGLNVLVYSLHQ